MIGSYSNETQESRKNEQWDRQEVACNVLNFEQEQCSQRQFAKEHGIPQSTLQYWLSRKKNLKGSAAVIAFFESPDGLAFLHLLMTAAHFVFTKLGISSIHNVSQFLELCGLSTFVGASYTTHQRASKEMDDQVIAFEMQERSQLIEKMPYKKITMMEDETFHHGICLVAMEPVSNFIMVEQYAENREGKTWNEVVKAALKGLKVEVIQVTSDEGSGLLNHVKKGLEVHHSSDIFHVSYEIGKGVSGAMASSVRKHEKAHEAACKWTEEQRQNKERHDHLVGNIEGRRQCEKKIEAAQEQEKQAELALSVAKERQKMVQVEKAKIGDVYHPYKLETGEAQDAQQVSVLLESCFSAINGAIEGLSEKSSDRVKKAHRVVKSLVATIAFYFCAISTFMDAMNLSPEDKELMENYLIPGCYLDEVGKKERNKEKKKAILKKSEELLSIVNQKEGPFSSQSEDEIKRLLVAARQCAQIFQRSSSNVEGRNAQLSLRYHGSHRLSDRRLKAQTIIHNFHIRNKERTTPAERFFEARHADLFEYILDRMQYPVRPRVRSRKSMMQTDTMAKAA